MFIPKEAENQLSRAQQCNNKVLAGIIVLFFCSSSLIFFANTCFAFLNNWVFRKAHTPISYPKLKAARETHL